MRIKECRMIEPFTCDEDENIVSVAKKLRAITLRHIFVLREEFPVGIISVMDINNRVVAEGKDLADVVAKDIMSVPIEVRSEEEDVSSVADDMIEKGRAMNAVVRDERMIGIVTLHELLRVKNETS
ncbi:MAG: CBS domain-containing protein [Nanobdellota archaeon]